MLDIADQKPFIRPLLDGRDSFNTGVVSRTGVTMERTNGSAAPDSSSVIRSRLGTVAVALICLIAGSGDNRMRPDCDRNG
jgi:hypothetical protein